MTTKYITKYVCPECGQHLNKIHRPNAWTNIYTPLLVCSNPECNFEINPHSRKEQEIFGKMLNLRICKKHEFVEKQVVETGGLSGCTISERFDVVCKHCGYKKKIGTTRICGD